MKGKNLQPRIPYPARLSFRFNGEIKNFTDKQKLREFRITRPALKQMLNKILQTKKAKTINKKVTNGKAYQKIQTIKVGNHPHINMISKLAIVRRVQMKNNENAFEIKIPAT